ncbi:MAG: Resolvase domain protein, partial [Thermomicrobiales bacterium]|nr:Resolvase domain protein [Thermomicrobiales bacterium]
IEREKIRERTIRGKRAKAEAGRVPSSGLDLYGYVKDRERGVRTIREDEAAVVRRIFDEAVEGRPIRDIVRRLNADGIPAPGAKVPGGSGRWWNSSVYRILHEPTYKGEAAAFRFKTTPRRGNRMRHVEWAPREEWIGLPDGVTPALVDAATWEAAQQRSTTNRGATTRNQERPQLLRGVVKCVRCGAPMLVEVSKGHVYYRCASRYRLAGSCGAPMVRADVLEAWTWEQITAVLEHPEIVRAELERIGTAGPDPALNAERDAAARALAKADAQAKRLLALYTASDEVSLPMDAVKAQLGQIEAERKAAAARLDAAERALATGAQRQAVYSSIDAALAKVSATLDTLDFHGRRKAVEALVESVVAGRDPASWRMGVVIPTNEDGVVFTTSR